MFNYSKPGKGVRERDPNQSRVSLFFELLSRKFWNLCKINIWHLIASIPMFVISFVLMGIFSLPLVNSVTNFLNITNTVAGYSILDIVLRVFFSFIFFVYLGYGPTTASFTYILCNYSKEKHVFFLSDWWEHLTSNFRQASIIMIIDFLIVFAFVISLSYYEQVEGLMRIGTFVIKTLILIYILMHFYIYQIMITFECSIWNIFKNALLFSLQRAPQNLLMLLITSFIHIGIPYMGIVFEWNILFWCIFIFAELMFLPSLTWFMINFFIYPQLKVYIVEMQKSDSNSKSCLE